MEAIMLRTLCTAAAITLAAGFSGTALAQDGAHPHWSYGGHTGPSHWGTLEKEYAACASGHAQSPIDIHSAGAKKTDLPEIQFAYKPSPLTIVDNGHTVQVNYAPGSFISVGDKQYELVQFHFHKPSEERINGKPYDMVAHLVHNDADGKLAVVAVLLKAGHTNPFIRTLWDNLPKAKETDVVRNDVSINAADLLPKSTGYYTFAGSLTTPPCSEGVTWFVLRDASPVSAQQVARFGKLYPMNARPIQSLHGRTVAASR